MNERFCKNCGNKINASAKFCKSCGAKTQAEPPARESPAPETEQSISGGVQAKAKSESKNSGIKAAAADIVSTAAFASQTAGAMVFWQNAGGLLKFSGRCSLSYRP